MRVDVRVPGRHEQGAAIGDPRRAFSRGPLLPAQRHPHLRPAAPRPQRGTSRCWPSTSWAASRASTARRVKTFDPSAMSVLQEYPWPGNVRELRNVHRAPDHHGARGDHRGARPGVSRRVPSWRRATRCRVMPSEESLTLQAARNRFEREFILRNARGPEQQHLAHGRGSGASKRSNLYRKMRALGVVGRANEKDEETI